MAKKKDDQNLPLNMGNDTETGSTITYATEVIAIIAGLAASEVDGVAGMVNVNSGLKGKNKNITRGIRVEVGTEEVSVDLYLNVGYGMPIQRVAHDAQEAVKKSIESMTGLHVVRVDVHVMGVIFEKDNPAVHAGQDSTALEPGEKQTEIEPCSSSESVSDELSTEADSRLQNSAVDLQMDQPEEKFRADKTDKESLKETPDTNEAFLHSSSDSYDLSEDESADSSNAVGSGYAESSDEFKA